jgi:hypothetical protein
VTRTITTRLIAAIYKFKQQKNAFFETKNGLEKKSLAFFFTFDEINELKGS